MKQYLHLAVLALLLLLPLGVQADDHDNPSVFTTVSTKDQQMSGVLTGTMPCPDNTVYSEAIDLTVLGSGKGITRSDRGYEGLSSQNYQSFEGNQHAIQGVRVFAVSAPADMNNDADNKRFHLDADGNMTEPLRLAVAFYTISNGYPGTEVYKEEVDVIGEKCDATYGEAAKGNNVVDIYSFTINLSEKVLMENGYVSVYAVQGDTLAPSCFCLVHDNNIQHTGYVVGHYWSSDDDTFAYSGGFNFCFLGNQNEGLASRGLKLQRVLSPESSETSPYATVQVELMNYGSQAISDAVLRLYEGDELLAQEAVGETIYSGAYHKYTFKQRIDCSAIGTHNFTIENATYNDAGLSDRTISFSTTRKAEGGSCDSHATYIGAYKYIKSVDIGSIHNESSYSTYSDFRDKKTTIASGQTLTLSVETQANNGDYLKVWVDWNGNGTFEDDGEFLGYISTGTMNVSIPSNATATAGDKTMRLISSNEDVSPCQTYTYGETEDYTLTITVPEGAAGFQSDTEQVVFSHPTTATNQREITVSSTGDAKLTADISIDYRLPQSPDVSSIAKAPARPSSERPAVSMEAAQTLPAGFNATVKTAATTADPFVLTYGNNTYSGNTGSQTTYVNYAHFFPGTVLKTIKGMKIESIDVYVATKARKSFVAVWKGTGVQYMNSTAKVKQQFTPTENAWNHIELSEPVTIDGTDLFIGCAFEGCDNVEYLVGVDRGPANTGFGDLISTSQSNYWWSLADLGYDNNVLIKANVIGERPAAIDWLSVDKTSLSIAPGSSDRLTITATTTGLDDQLYEAAVRLNTNDPLAGAAKIPVWLDRYDAAASISLLPSAAAPAFRVSSGSITVLGDTPVSYIALFTVDGRQLDMVFSTNRISTDALQHGLYVVKAVLDDNTSVRGTVVVK